MALLTKCKVPQKVGDACKHGFHSLPLAGISGLHLSSMHTDLANLANEHGPIFRLAGSTIVVGDADLAEHMLSPRYAGHAFGRRWEDTEFFPFAKWGEILGASKSRHETSGIFFGNGPEHWKPPRKAAEKGFLHGRAIRESGESAAGAAASDLAERWASRGMGHFDVHSDLRDATLKVVTRVAFGEDEVLDKDAMNELMDIYSTMISNLDDVTGVPPGTWWIAKRSQSKQLHETADRLRSLLVPVFQKRKLRADDGPRRCIMDLLIDSGMSEGAVLLNALQILGAGHDTTATSLALLLWHLGRDMNLQEAVRAEVREALAADDTAGWKDIPNLRLPLLSACVKEVLRMFPAAPIILRQASENAPSWKGVEFPAGTIALVMPWLLGRNAELWGDPQNFRPQRFMEDPNRDSAAHKFALLPFGYGLRSCVGQHLAVAELKVFVAALLSRLHLTADETPPCLEWFLTLRLREGLKLQIDLAE